MDTVIQAVLITAIASTASPLLLAYLTGRQRRLEKLEDYARQDAVAAKAPLRLLNRLPLLRIYCFTPNATISPGRMRWPV
jgi:hypothetical protein